MQTQSSSALNADIEAAQCRSGVWTAFALGFSPPSAESRALATTERAERFSEALAHAGVPQGWSTMAVDVGELADTYAVLFGHTARGRASAYETEHGGGDDLFFQTREQSDIGAFLSAFGLTLDRQHRERVDHIRVECEFMAFLALKEAYALEHTDQEMLTLTRSAERLFLRDHLGRFAPALGAQLGRLDAAGFYGALGRALERFVQVECERFAVKPGGATRPEVAQGAGGGLSDRRRRAARSRIRRAGASLVRRARARRASAKGPR
jgi:TorA maturation chaperone TorD